MDNFRGSVNMTLAQINQWQSKVSLFDFKLIKQTETHFRSRQAEYLLETDFREQAGQYDLEAKRNSNRHPHFRAG
jgi:hypothetical protein